MLFAPPPRLASVILETRGSAKSGELSLREARRRRRPPRDELEIVRGAVFRNGSRETPYVTGTPVGVTAAEANADEANADEAIASTAFENVEHENGRPVTCDVCKTASYDLRPTRVPPGTFSCSETTAVEAWMDTSGGTFRSKTCAAWCGSGSDR